MVDLDTEGDSILQHVNRWEIILLAVCVAFLNT